MNFSASFDKFTHVVTWVSIPLVAVGYLLLYNFTSTAQSALTPIMLGGFFTLMLLVFFICYGFHVKYYTIKNGTIEVNRVFGVRVIDGIISIQQVPDADLKRSIRTFGVGGLFGFFGYFYNSKYGKMKWFATRLSNFVLVETDKNEKIVITPDDPENFVKHFRNF